MKGKLMAIIAGTILAVTGATLPALVSGITVDISGAPESQSKGATNMLSYLGIHTTGTTKENNEVWCVFNDWKARDQQAKYYGTYNTGRFTTSTTFGGKWYCAHKRQ